MPSVLLVETEELLPWPAELRGRWWQIPPSVGGVAAGVSAVTATLLAAIAPFQALFVSTTTSRAPGSTALLGAPARFQFDGWGRPLTPQSTDSIGFPFAGHGPSFGVATSVCAAVLVVAALLRLRHARSGTGGRPPAATWLGLAGGAALLALGAAMWLTVQPGVQVHDHMTRTTSMGPCAWLTAAAGVVAVAGEVASAAAARRGGRDEPAAT